MLEVHDVNGVVIKNDIESVSEVACSPNLQMISYSVSGELTAPKVGKHMAPLGKTMEFAPVWDGIDLIETYT